MTKKQCPNCYEHKSLTEYPKRGKEHRRKYCVDCRPRIRWRESDRSRRKRNKELSDAYKSEEGCRHCDIRNPLVLQFHHERDKEFNIGQMVHKSLSWSKIEKEIRKCIVLCANCHIMEHHRLETFKNLNKPKE